MKEKWGSKQTIHSYILDLAASFAVGGTWVMIALITAQRFGGKVGGFIAGLPATSVLAIFFITYSEGARNGFDLTGIFPLAISFRCRKMKSNIPFNGSEAIRKN